MKNESINPERRDFLKTTAALGAVSAFPGIISAQTVTNAIKVGLVGCGAGGRGAASATLAADDNAQLPAPAGICITNIAKSPGSLRRLPESGSTGQGSR